MNPRRKLIGCSLLAAMLMATGNLDANNAPPVERVTLPVSRCVFVSKGTVADGKQLVATDIEGRYQTMLSFRTFMLDPARPLAIREASLCLGVQYLRQVQVDNAVPPVLSFHRLLKPIDSYADQAKVELKAGQDYEAEGWFTFPLPADVKVHDELVIPLPLAPGSADATLGSLRNGLVVLLKRAGPTSVLQVNLHGWKPSRARRHLRPHVEIVVQPQNPKLELTRTVVPRPGKYVMRKGPDFYYDGRPIRFFGVNLGAGDFTSYEAIDNCVNRLRSMNFNAVRLWATGHPFYTPESASQGKMVESKKGDGSKLDLYDYFVYRLQEAGLFVHNTALGHMPPTNNWPGIDVVLERKKVVYDPAYYNVFPIMRYLHDGFLAASEQHIRLYLNRVNPYTGQRYGEMPVFATWELANENHTVAYILDGRFHKWPPAFKEHLQLQWNRWLTRQYKDRSGLLAAWGAAAENEDPAAGTVEPAPTYDQVKDYPKARARDFIRFMQELFISGSKRLEIAARSCAAEGMGINIAPIMANTHADLNLHAQYPSASLDFASVAVYQTPYTTDPSRPHYPWRPMCTERPYFYNLNFQTIDNKPFLVYEHAPHRPYHYRAEWNPALTLMGAGLGWDALYMYIFGQPWAICDNRISDIGFVSKPLAIPYDTSHNGYCVGFHQGNDEILMASMALTGQAFINGIKPNRQEVRVTFGRPAIEGPEYRHYSPAGPAAPLPERDMAGGEAEWYIMPNIYRKFMHTSVRKRLLLAFDPDQEAPISIRGELSDITGLGDQDRQKLTPSDDVTWDPANERFVLDTPHSKIVVGFIPDGYTFKDGVKLGAINRDFAFFGISSRDGKPIAESRDLLLAIVSTSANTDYKLDPKKIKGSVLGHINGIVNRGRAPVIVDRVGATVELPGVSGRLECYNFARYRYRSETISGKISFSADEPLFLARIRR